MIETLLIILGLLIAVVGLMGCIIPALPGPPLNFLSLVILELAIDDAFTADFYFLWGGITIAVTVLDYILPIFNASHSSLPAISSPSTAPINKPTIIPKGGKNKIPIIIPMMEPQIPKLLALYTFAPITGRI